MATDNRLRAKIPPRHAERISDVARDKGMPETDAERTVIKEGLAAMGYVERPTEPHNLLLYYVRKIGLVLGFCGLITIGYGVFGPRAFSLIGLALTIAGFLLVAVEEGLREYTARYEAASQ